ncbi:MAG: MFS transporter [Betaproteobacteria bacterium]|nr:MAG: MFS transporter [Betaproteobacteria bacterium]
MLGFSTYAALLPQLRDEWRMSNAEAGVVSGMFFAGYIGTVSLWTALTDRIDARKVYATGSLFAAAGSAGFGFVAGGFASAVMFQVLLGVGIAATYMPGPEPLHRVLYIVLRYRHSAVAGHGRIHCTGLRLARGVRVERARTARRRRDGAFTRSPARPGRRAILGAQSLSAARLAARACGSPERGLHARLYGALPRTLRFTCVDGGVSRVLGEPARWRFVSVVARRYRGGGESACRAGLDPRQRSRAAHRTTPLDPAGDGRVGVERPRARLGGALALDPGARVIGRVLDAGDGGIGHADRRPRRCRAGGAAGRGDGPLFPGGLRRRPARPGGVRRRAGYRRWHRGAAGLDRRVRRHRRGMPRRANRG